MPESVSLEHWQISPDKVKAYLKTNKWRKVVEEAAHAVDSGTIASAEERPKP